MLYAVRHLVSRRHSWSRRTMLHVSMGYCIRLAYGTWRSYVLAGPAWIDPPTDVLVDIIAKAASPVTQDQIKSMLQTLLAKREISRHTS
jgi:uncharacterized protein (TIGR03435 family)